MPSACMRVMSLHVRSRHDVHQIGGGAGWKSRLVHSLVVRLVQNNASYTIRFDSFWVEVSTGEGLALGLHAGDVAPREVDVAFGVHAVRHPRVVHVVAPRDPTLLRVITSRLPSEFKFEGDGQRCYRGTSLIRNRAPLGPYCRTPSTQNRGRGGTWGPRSPTPPSCSRSGTPRPHPSPGHHKPPAVRIQV